MMKLNVVCGGGNSARPLNPIRPRMACFSSFNKIDGVSGGSRCVVVESALLACQPASLHTVAAWPGWVKVFFTVITNMIKLIGVIYGWRHRRCCCWKVHIHTLDVHTKGKIVKKNKMENKEKLMRAALLNKIDNFSPFSFVGAALANCDTVPRRWWQNGIRASTAAAAAAVVA